jgi:hypothetical protein
MATVRELGQPPVVAFAIQPLQIDLALKAS